MALITQNLTVEITIAASILIIASMFQMQGLAVFDVMRRMTCPLITINAGLTVGLGALLCAVGTSGQR
jgi:ATP-dependent protease ClpP protease subunit